LISDEFVSKHSQQRKVSARSVLDDPFIMDVVDAVASNDAASRFNFSWTKDKQKNFDQISQHNRFDWVVQASSAQSQGHKSEHDTGLVERLFALFGEDQELRGDAFEPSPLKIEVKRRT
jgi:hypothetical protein